MSEIKCGWCNEKIPHIFAGDEVNIKGEHYFCCMVCVELVRTLDKRREKNE